MKNIFELGSMFEQSHFSSFPLFQSKNYYFSVFKAFIYNYLKCVGVFRTIYVDLSIQTLPKSKLRVLIFFGAIKILFS